jgi:catechol 2,3-dioxygenase-like lactoylglutathione lyase family enzyme
MMKAFASIGEYCEGMILMRTKATTLYAVLLMSLVSLGFAQVRPKITSVSHLSVYTSDATKTEHFYVDDLGAFKTVDPQNPAGVRYYFNSHQFVEVLPLPSGASDPKNRFDHAAYNTSNAEAMRTYLAAHGVAVPSSVIKAADGSQYFEVRDPEENRVEFIQLPLHPAPMPANPLSSHIIHVGYIVHNSTLENGFYQKLLGFRPYWHGGPTEDSSEWMSMQLPDGSDWLEYMNVKGPEKTGIPASMSQETAGVLDHFALGIHNAEKAYNLLYAGNRLNTKHGNPQLGRDGKWQLNIYDPDGIRAELMEFQPSVKPCCSPFLLPSPTH